MESCNSFDLRDMKRLSQVVAVLVLIVIGTLPVFAATLCQKTTQVSACCRHECSKMAGMGKSSVHPQTGSTAAIRSCCKVIPVAPVTMSTPLAQHVSGQVVLVNDTIVGAAALATQRAVKNHIPSDRQSPGRSSQSILCTFLI